MTDKESLDKLVQAVSLAHADIAPGYLDYVIVAFALAHQFGESARESFHQLVSYSPKYNRQHAEHLYNEALVKSRGKVKLGSVFHLAKLAGVEISYPRGEERKPSFPPLARDTFTHTCVPINVEPYPPTPPIPQNEGSEETYEEEELKLPLFPAHTWPPFLQQMIDCAPTPAQGDALLLSSITVLGTTLNWLVYTFYGDGETYPNLFNFITGKPASGKSVASWAHQLARPYHEQCLQQNKAKHLEYLKAKQAWDYAGAKRQNLEMPIEPSLSLFIIPGNNSATGIKENLILNQGIGLIAETESDTLSSANNTDYGGFSDTLRKGYDNDEISYYRRTNSEYRQCPKSCFGVQLTGTFGQIGRLIHSAEDGLYSRFLFYILPPVYGWKNQFKQDKVNYRKQFYAWAKTWKTVLDAIRSVATSFELEISRHQMERFNDHFAKVFGKASIVYGDRIDSAVARLGISLCRMACVVAFLRAIDSVLPTGEQDLKEVLPDHPKQLLDKLLKSPYLALSRQQHADNINDKVSSAFTMTIQDEDFEALLQLVEPLYKHAGAVLSVLPSHENPTPKQEKKQKLLDNLPMTFTRTEALKLGASLHLTEKAIDCQLTRAIRRGILKKEERGIYSFISRLIEG